MYRKGEKVVYPKHGAGKIADIYKEKISDEKEKYYKIKFFESPIDIAIPVEKAEELGLRSPLSRSALQRELKRLNRKLRITKKTLVNLDPVSKIKLNSGKMDDAIDLVNLLKSLAKQKEEENKNFSYSYSDRLEIAMDFIKSEVQLVLGEKALKRYNLF